ncbi:uncharacterized protein LOC117324865 [Pecten maximus]|uniref:uncharacterized protein LOC117324865 n=1 Tax=Pecten maximus TaxID=6579 RepID=UPI00145873AF|nr:uncharacterized protein LOC117324865 [Pecten maximus]
MNNTAPDHKILNDIELDVIQSSCPFENIDSGQNSNSTEFVALTTAIVNAPVNQDLRTNKSVTDNENSKEKISKRVSKENTTNKTMTRNSNSDILKDNIEDGMIENMNVSVTFGRGRRKKKLSNSSKAEEDKTAIEQTKTVLPSDIQELNDDSMDIASTISEKDKNKEQTEQSKKNINQRKSQARKNTLTNPDLDVYDFDEVDRMKRSFDAGKMANSCKTDMFVECEVDVHSETDKDIQQKNDGVMILEKKSGTKDKKSNTPENKELNTKVTCDEEVVTNQPFPRTENRKSKLCQRRKTAQESAINTSDKSTRKIRSNRPRRTANNKTYAEESDTESQTDKEIEVIKSSLNSENDGGLIDDRKSRNKDKTVLKSRKTRQVVVSTPLDNLEASVANFDGANEILSSIDCSNKDRNKGCVGDLEKVNTTSTKDKEQFTEKNKHDGDTTEQNGSFENDRQSDQLTVLAQKKECFSKDTKGKSGRPKRKASQLREDSQQLSKTKHQMKEKSVMSRKKKVNECDSDVQSECEDDIQNADVLAGKNAIKKTEAKERKSTKSEIVNLEKGQSDNKQANKTRIQNSRKARLSERSDITLETTADTNSLEQTPFTRRVMKELWTAENFLEIETKKC